MAGAAPVLEEDAEAAWELFVLGVQEPPISAKGDAEGAAWFRARLEELGFTQGAFARFMVRRGDTRPKRNVLRSVQRMCAGQARVPGEMRVLLGLMLRSKRRSTARAAKRRDEREAPCNDLSETRRGPEEQDAPATPAGVSPGPSDEQAESDGRDAPPGDLSGPRSQPRKRDPAGATEAELSVKRRSQAEWDGC